jgi:nucleoside-diphosphate-sugar epimerase
MTRGKILVAGAGGFIGGHMVKILVNQGAQVRAVDRKPIEHWYQHSAEAENLVLDLRERSNCDLAASCCERVVNLACDMGGMGFLEANKARCMLSVLINTNLLEACREAGTDRYFFSSSACVYNADKQSHPDVVALREEDAYPAQPEDGYGWEKLFSERLCRHYREDFGITTVVARLHNVYGPHGTYEGGREKAPAAICRKVIQAIKDDSGMIEIWGDGNQTRSFMYIEDCLEGIMKLDATAHPEPVNLGSSELVSINQLVDIVEEIAGVRLTRAYKLDAPRGVAGRNSDNSLIRSLLDWEPTISLKEGMTKTYQWIYCQMMPTQ